MGGYDSLEKKTSPLEPPPLIQELRVLPKSLKVQGDRDVIGRIGLTQSFRVVGGTVEMDPF